MKITHFFILFTLSFASLFCASENTEQEKLQIENNLKAAQSKKESIDAQMENIRKRIAQSPDRVSLASPLRKHTASELIDVAIKAGEQQYIINQSSKQLAELIQQPISASPNIHEKSLSNTVMATLIRALARFRPGYGRTEEERDKANTIITELKKQKNELTKTYENQQDSSSPSFPKYDDKYKNYEYDMRKFDYAIRQQEIIAGKALLPYLWETEQGPAIRPLQ